MAFRAWAVRPEDFSHSFTRVFRPCIDLHEGQVKQIVGGSLSNDPSTLRTHFVSTRPASWYAELYRSDGLRGGHVIMLGAGNESAAREALAAYPGGLQVGGGIRTDNAAAWIDAGASHVIVTSWLFEGARLCSDRLEALTRRIGRHRLVIDLSCRRREGRPLVVTNRWRTFTDLEISADSLQRLAASCDEFLVHAADVEGLCAGMDLELIASLAAWSPIPVTYAGGAGSIDDLETVNRIGAGKVDLTIGSALDIFGGSGARYADAVAFNQRHPR